MTKAPPRVKVLLSGEHLISEYDPERYEWSTEQSAGDHGTKVLRLWMPDGQNIKIYPGHYAVIIMEGPAPTPA